jgi:putative endonuclease
MHRKKGRLKWLVFLYFIVYLYLMAEVYILYSKSRDKYYIGSCQGFQQRLEEHIGGKYAASFTANTHDWQPFLVIHNLKYLQAREIEKHIKRMKSRKYLHNIKNYPVIIERLKKKYQ